jgi:hypothetical protein
VPEIDLAAILRNMKIPENLSASQGLREYLLAQSEGRPQLPERDEELQKQTTTLLLLSHLEVLNALGALEERMSRKRRRRWF